MLPDQASTAAPGAGNRIAFNSYLLLITETKIQGGEQTATIITSPVLFSAQ